MNKISNFINAKKRDLNPVFLTLEIDCKKMLLCYNYIKQNDHLLNIIIERNKNNEKSY